MNKQSDVYELVPDFPFSEDGEPWFIEIGSKYYSIGIRPWIGRRAVTIADCPLVSKCSPGPVCARDYMLSLDGFPLFSDAMMQMIDRLDPGAMDWLPIVFHRPRSRERIAGYSIGATNHTIDAIDRDRTRVSQDDWTPRDNGTLRVLYPIWIRGDLIPDCCIFRLSGSPSELWVTEQFKQAVEESGLTGCRFRKAHIS